MFTYDDNLYSDIHKDAYGFRPGVTDIKMWDDMCATEKQKSWDNMANTIVMNGDFDKMMEEEAILSFKDELDTYLTHGAKDEREALRWMMQNETICHEQDVEGFIWGWGILFTEYGKRMVAEIKSFVEYETPEWMEG